MIRGFIAALVGLVAWAIVATALDMGLRVAIPGYGAAEPRLQFTLGMMLARLALPGAVPSIVAGFSSAWIARGKPWATGAVTVVLLGMFLPTHYRLWDKFPVWYHATFIGSLIVLPALGAWLAFLVASSRRGRSAAEAAVSTGTSRITGG